MTSAVPDPASAPSPDRAGRELLVDLGLYAAAGTFAAITAATSTLLPHRAWGTVATTGYLVAALVAAAQWVARRGSRLSTLTGTTARGILAAFTLATTTLLPLVLQTIERAGGRTDRAQEEVMVIEQAGARLWEHGTPYLTREAIAALPEAERLLGYTPYQPGMALFGLPRAVVGGAWWTDARVMFALATVAALGAALAVLRRADRLPDADGAPRASGTEGTEGTEGAKGVELAAAPGKVGQLDPALVRAGQLATVFPVCALTLTTGGDDLPVLALCLLALALAATRRPGRSGLAVGLAGALKLFAWPVALVLVAHAVTQGRRAALRLTAGAVGLPLLALVPAQLVDGSALTENVLRFPLGHGLVTSPAASPLPGHLIAQALPAGRVVAAALLVAAGLLIAVRLLRRPPVTAAATAALCGYGLLTAIMLMPATRFGYLLYPIALLGWVPALRLVSTGTATTQPAPAPTPAP